MYDPLTGISPYFNPAAADPMGVVAQAQALQNVGSGVSMGRGGMQSYDAFRAPYQRATGDVTGDPFLGLGDRNIARVYNQNAANYNNQIQGTGIYAGGGVPAPTSSAAVAATAAGRPAVPRAPELANIQDPRVANTRAIATLQMGNQTAYAMAHPEYDPTNITAQPAHQAVLRSLGVNPPSDQSAFERLSSTGVMPKPAEYISQNETDPVSPSYGLDTKLWSDPKFQSYLKLDPQGAAQTYERLTGTPLAAAYKTLAARHQDREKFDDSMVAALQNNIVWDDKTGDWATLRRVRKPADRFNRGGSEVEFQDVHEPLNPIEKKWLESGAFERKTGMSLADLRGRPRQLGQMDPRARLAELAARRGTPNKTIYDDNPAFVNMMQGMRSEYPVPGLQGIIPASMFNPAVAADTARGIVGDIGNVVGGALDTIGRYAAPFTPDYPH